MVQYKKLELGYDQLDLPFKKGDEVYYFRKSESHITIGKGILEDIRLNIRPNEPLNYKNIFETKYYFAYTLNTFSLKDSKLHRTLTSDKLFFDKKDILEEYKKYSDKSKDIVYYLYNKDGVRTSKHFHIVSSSSLGNHTKAAVFENNIENINKLLNEL